MMFKQYKANMNDFPIMMDFVAECLSQYAISVVEKKNVQLILEECLINIINYSYQEEEGEIFIEHKKCDSQLVFIVKNAGVKFNPLTYEENISLDSDLSSRKPGGLGIYFMKKLSDEIHYNYNNGYNEVIIKKNIIDQEN